MYIQIFDDQVVGAVESQAFSLIQQAPIAPQINLTNTGANIIGYRFQSLQAGSWHDLATLGNPLNNTLSPLQTVALAIESDYPQVRLLAYATGGSTLQFAVQRQVNRVAGGVIPLLNY